MSINRNAEQIEWERQRVFSQRSPLVVTDACGIGKGILRLSDKKQSQLCKDANRLLGQTACFIPSSGVGSRMFEGLARSMEQVTGNDSNQLRWFQELNRFPFYRNLAEDVRHDSLLTLNFLLNKEGLGYANLPKGMIPFHTYGSDWRSAFEEHLVQHHQEDFTVPHLHFTLQSDHLMQVEKHLGQAVQRFNISSKLSFSVQDDQTDSFVFGANGELVFSGGKELRRPSGHGALLGNLALMEEDIILLRNIDNIPHNRLSNEVNRWWKILISLVQEIKEEIRNQLNAHSMEGLFLLNEKYGMYSDSEIASCLSLADVCKLLNRPIRVCGMVKNSGQPGGGPFWVQQNGVLSKQIVELSQISRDENQMSIIKKSTHFNPVMMAVSIKNTLGTKFNLPDFVDENAGLVVDKEWMGKSIRYIERPGLWNGGMAYWNSVFIEVPEKVFAPVKTVFDLLNDEHQPQ
jgi:hypothetical protein